MSRAVGRRAFVEQRQRVFEVIGAVQSDARRRCGNKSICSRYGVRHKRAYRAIQHVEIGGQELGV